jgi:hypothetical protein
VRRENPENLGDTAAYRHVSLIIPERTFFPEYLFGEHPMKRSRPESCASSLLRKVRFVYEYPGHLVLADIARLKKTIKRAYYTAMRGV